MNVFNGKPEEILAPEPKTASPLLRLAAFFLDGLILFPALIPLVILSNHSLKATFLLAPAYPVLYMAYQAIFHARFGANLGKMVLKMKVVKEDFSPIDFYTALKRISVEGVLHGASAILLLQIFLSLKNGPAFASAADLTKAIQAGTPWSQSGQTLNLLNWGWDYVSFMTCVFSPKRKALHDFIAGTIVVRERIIAPRGASRAQGPFYFANMNP